MRTIERKSRFKRDYKREMKGRHRATLDADLMDALIAVASNAPLDARYQDHGLSGDWVGYRDWHVKPDLVPIYAKPDDLTLRLARLGSHSTAKCSGERLPAPRMKRSQCAALPQPWFVGDVCRWWNAACLPSIAGLHRHVRIPELIPMSLKAVFSIAMSALIVGSPACALAAAPDTIASLSGAYQEPGTWTFIRRVDARHAYVHIWLIGGIGGDLISEFEQVMTVRRGALVYSEAGTTEEVRCSLTVQRVGSSIKWSAPQSAPCSSRANSHFPGIFMEGSIALASKRRSGRTSGYPGEGIGYAATVAAWRSTGRQ